MQYYHPSKKVYSNCIYEIEKTDMNASEIIEQIKLNRVFCRDEKSINRQELSSYVSDGITFFIYDGVLKGLINFDINMGAISVRGLCVPEEYKGNGTVLINAVKSFASTNDMSRINLTSYGDVHNFYKKQGFAIEEENDTYDSDDEFVSTSYNMVFLSKGKRKRKTKTKHKRKLKSKRKLKRAS
jgi:GNAT superfamily N-acetyltransferase